MYSEPGNVNALRNHHIFTEDIRWEVKYCSTQYSQSRGFQDWRIDPLTSQQLKAPLQLISNFQSRPYSRLFPAEPAPQPISARTPERVKQCGCISSNAVQGASGRDLTWGVDCKGAHSNNGHSHEHSREQLKAPLQLISNFRSRPYSRWFPAGPAPRTNYSSDVMSA